MKLYQIFETTDPESWDNNVPDPSTLKEKYADAIKKFNNAMYFHNFTNNQRGEFTRKYLLHKHQPGYDESFHFKTAGGREMGVVPTAPNPQFIIARYNKFHATMVQAEKQVRKYARLKSKYKKEMKAVTLAALKGQKFEITDPKDIPQKILVGNGKSFKNPYFSEYDPQSSNRWAGSVGQYPFYREADKTLLANIQQILEENNIPGFTTIFGVLRGGLNFFVAYAANKKLVWKRNGSSNRFWANGTAFSGTKFIDDAHGYQKKILDLLK